MTYYAYLHVKPTDNGVHSIFYVGKGKGGRAHDLKRTNPHHKNTVQKYGIENISVAKIECSTEDSAFQLEVGLIKCLRRMGVKLTNKTDGGDGVRGFIRDAAWRRRQSEFMKGRPSSCKGTVVPEERRLRISATLKANNYWQGKTHTQESRDKMGVTKGTKWMNKAGESKRVHPDEISSHLSSGWTFGVKPGVVKADKGICSCGNDRKGRLYITDGVTTQCIRVPMLPPNGWVFGQTRKKRIR